MHLKMYLNHLTSMSLIFLNYPTFVRQVRRIFQMNLVVGASLTKAIYTKLRPSSYPLIVNREMEIAIAGTRTVTRQCTLHVHKLVIQYMANSLLTKAIYTELRPSSCPLIVNREIAITGLSLKRDNALFAFINR